MEHDDIEKAELSRLSLVCALFYVNVGVIVKVIKKKSHKISQVFCFPNISVFLESRQTRSIFTVSGQWVRFVETVLPVWFETYITGRLNHKRSSCHNKHNASFAMESQGTSNAYCGQSTDGPQWNTYEPNNGDVSFVQSLLSSPGADVLDYPDGSNTSNGANESEAERQRREKNNLASRKSRAFKKERFAAMTEEIEQLQEENNHLRNVVQEMDSVIYEAKGMVMQANQCLPWFSSNWKPCETTIKGTFFTFF